MISTFLPEVWCVGKYGLWGDQPWSWPDLETVAGHLNTLAPAAHLLGVDGGEGEGEGEEERQAGDHGGVDRGWPG